MVKQFKYFRGYYAQNHFFMFLMLMLIIEAAIGASLTGSISASPSQIAQSATYTISINRPNTASQIPYGAYIKITFPSTSYTITNGAIPCSGVIGFGGSLTCTASSNVITLTGGYPNPGSGTGYTETFINFDIENINNPILTSKTSVFSLVILTSTGTVLDTLVDPTFYFQATPGVLASCQMTSSSDIVGALSTATVQFATNNEIPQGGYVQLVIPLWNSDDPVTSDIVSMLVTPGASCSSFVGIGSSASCTWTSSNNTLALFSGFSTQKTGTMSFQVSQIRNPLSTAPKTGFTLMTFDGLGNEIEYCSTLSLTVSTPATITTADFFCSNNYINVADQCQVTFLTVLPLSVNSAIRITFPAEMSLSLLSSNAVVGQTGVAIGPLSYTIISSNTLLITNGVNTYKGSGTNFTVVIRNVQLPSTTAVTSTFVVDTETSTGALVAEISSGLTYSAIPGMITSITITATDPTVESTTTFNFLFTPTDNLPTTAGVEITFPTELTIANQASGACASGNTASVNPSPSCSVSSQVLTVSDLFLSSYAGGTQIGFTVNLVTNPSSTKPTFTFLIQTYSDINSPSTLTDQSNTATYAATNYALLNQAAISIVPSSLEVSNLTEYTFAFNNTNVFFSLGTIVIQIPSTITIPITANAQNSFTVISPLAGTATVSVNSTTIVITNAVSSNLAADSSISFSLTGLQNPPTLQPTTSFTIITETSDGYLIDGINSGVTVTMTSVPTFYHIQIIPSSYYNSAVTVYTFEITVRNPHYTGDSVKITFPTEITFPNVPTCDPTTNLLAFSTPCVKSGQVLVVKPNFSPSTFPAQTVFIFEVPSCTNPISLQPFASFQIASYSSTGYKREETLTGLTFTTIANPIYTISITPYDDIPGDATNYTVYFQPVTPIPSTGVIMVHVPAEFEVTSTVNCIFNQGILGSSATCEYNSTSRMITLSNGGPFSGSVVNFTFSGLTNPSTGISSTFDLYTYTSSSGYIMDQNISNLIYQAYCSSPCRTCNASSSSNCTSCFNSSLSSMIYLYYGSCLTACPSGAPADSSNVCTPCGSACATCDQSTGNCTSCNSSSYSVVDGECQLITQFGIQLLKAILDDGGAPFPFLISAACIFIFILITSLAFKHMIFTSNLLAFYGLLEYAAKLTFLILLCKIRNWSFSISATLADSDFILIVVSLIINYFLNFGLIIYYFLKVRTDPGYLAWLKQSGVTCCSDLVLVFSAITSLKFFPIFYGRFFDFKIFSARCSSTHVLFPLSVLMGFHGLLSGGTAITSAILHLSNAGFLPNQSTITAIELPIVVILTFVVFLFEIRKPKDYFDQPSTEMEKYLKVDEESKIALGSSLRAAQISKSEHSEKFEPSEKHLKQTSAKTQAKEKNTEHTENSSAKKKPLKKFEGKSSMDMDESPNEIGLVKAGFSDSQNHSDVPEPESVKKAEPLKVSTIKSSRKFQMQRQEMLIVHEKKPVKVTDPLVVDRNHKDNDIPALSKGLALSVDEKAAPNAEKSFNGSINDSKLQLINNDDLHEEDLEGSEEAEQPSGQGQVKANKNRSPQNHSPEQTNQTRKKDINSQGKSQISEKHQEQRHQIKPEKARVLPNQKLEEEQARKEPTRQPPRDQGKTVAVGQDQKQVPAKKKQKTDPVKKTEAQKRKETPPVQARRLDEKDRRLPAEQKRQPSPAQEKKNREINSRKSTRQNSKARNQPHDIRSHAQSNSRRSDDMQSYLSEQISDHLDDNRSQEYPPQYNTSDFDRKLKEPDRQAKNKTPDSNSDWKPQIYARDTEKIKVIPENAFVDPSYVPDRNEPIHDKRVSKPQPNPNNYGSNTNDEFSDQDNIEIHPNGDSKYSSPDRFEKYPAYTHFDQPRADSNQPRADPNQSFKQRQRSQHSQPIQHEDDEEEGMSPYNNTKSQYSDDDEQKRPDQDDEATFRGGKPNTPTRINEDSHEDESDQRSPRHSSKRDKVERIEHDENQDEIPNLIAQDAKTSGLKPATNTSSNHLQRIDLRKEIKQTPNPVSIKTTPQIKKQGNLEETSAEFLQAKKLKSKGDQPQDRPISNQSNGFSGKGSRVELKSNGEASRYPMTPTELNESVLNAKNKKPEEDINEMHKNPLDNLSDHLSEKNSNLYDKIQQESPSKLDDRATIELDKHNGDQKPNSTNANDTKPDNAVIKNNFFEPDKLQEKKGDVSNRYQQSIDQEQREGIKKDGSKGKGTSQATGKKNPQFEIEDYSHLEVGATHEVVNEETPSAYNAMNQRYDDDVNHRPSAYQPYNYRARIKEAQDMS